MFAGIGAVGRIGRPGLSGSAALAKRPTLSLDFMQPGAMNSRVTFTRASSATYTDASSVIQTAATNAPRWDYANGVLRGLLIEDQRTNSLSNSDPSVSGIDNNTTRTANAGIAPDGTNTLVKMNNTTANAFHGLQYIAPGTANARYCCSIYAKMGQIRYLQLILDDLGGGQPAAISTFDLQTGTITAATHPSTMINVGNGVYRCGIENILVGAGTTQVRLGTNNCLIPNPGFYDHSYVGVPTDGTYLWGVQIEQGTFGTSYIPTTGVAATRAQEQCGISSVNMSPWFSPPGGSWAAEYIETDPVDYSNDRIIGMGSFTASDPTTISIGGGFTAGTWDGANAVISSNTGSANVVQKVASSYTPGTTRICLNGGIIASGFMNTGFGIFSTVGIKFLIVYGPGTAQNASGYIRRVNYWNRVLTDAEMQQVTT